MFPGMEDLGGDLIPGMVHIGTGFPRKVLKVFHSLKSCFLFRIRRRILHVFSDASHGAAAKWILTRICATFKAFGFVLLGRLATTPIYTFKFLVAKVDRFL